MKSLTALARSQSSLEHQAEWGVVCGRFEEVEDILHVLVRVVHDLAAVVEIRVNVVGLHDVAHLILGLLSNGVWACGVPVTEEESERSRIDQSQVVQVSLFLAQGNPVAVRVPLEAVLLGVLRVMEE